MYLCVRVLAYANEPYATTISHFSLVCLQMPSRVGWRCWMTGYSTCVFFMCKIVKKAELDTVEALFIF